MIDKILCPWCGAEMRTLTEPMKGYERTMAWNAWMVCKNFACQAEGPFVQESTLEEAMDSAKAAALRRYTTPLKPMTLCTVAKVADQGEYMWMEKRLEDDVTPCMCAAIDGVSSTMFYIESTADELMCADYGKTWRCWERKPTDEEWSAAGWEM